MEVAGVVFRPAPCFSSGTADTANSRRFHTLPTVKRQSNRKSVAALACLGCDKFSDKGHLQYYSYDNGPRMAMKEKVKKEIKKKLKVLKGLSKNLCDFSDMGFGLNPDHGLDHQVKGQIISEATEVLLGQLQKLRAEKLESKRKKKEEKARKKASRMTMTMDSSESSSSSSDLECENVMNPSQLKSLTIPNGDQEAATSLAVAEASKCHSIGVGIDDNSEASKKTPCLTVPAVSKCVDGNGEGLKKIEVCMGGKCKKSGAALLMENFEKAVGGEATVVGCKCMGKCRDGPNVRVRDNPLCIGVGLEDVDMIVTNFFGGNHKSTSDLVPV